MDIFFKSMLSFLKNYINFTMIYHFLLEKMKIIEVAKLVANLHDRKCCCMQKNFKTSTKLWIKILKKDL